MEDDEPEWLLVECGVLVMEVGVMVVEGGVEELLTMAGGGDSAGVTFSSEPLRPARGEMEFVSS